MSSAPLRGSFLRWVPGRIPLSLHAPGKAADGIGARSLNSAFPDAWNERSGVEGDPGPSARLAKRRLLFLSQRSPDRRGPTRAEPRGGLSPRHRRPSAGSAANGATPHPVALPRDSASPSGRGVSNPACYSFASRKARIAAMVAVGCSSMSQCPELGMTTRAPRRRRRASPPPWWRRRSARRRPPAAASSSGRRPKGKRGCRRRSSTPATARRILRARRAPPASCSRTSPPPASTATRSTWL